MKNRLVFTLITLFVAYQSYSQADSVTLITDRPTQSASAYTIAKGSWQIETGFGLTNFKLIGPLGIGTTEWKIQNISLNTTLVRFGISDEVELNFGQTLTRTRLIINDDVQDGASTDLLPTTIGLRFQLAEESGVLPQISFLGNYVGAPFVNGGGGGGMDLRLNMLHNLDDGWSIGYNLGGVANGFFDDFSFLYTVVVGKSLNDKLAAFVEAYGFFFEGASNPHSLDYGFTYLINKDLQLDVSAGNALNDFAPDFIFGLGFSARIPRN